MNPIADYIDRATKAGVIRSDNDLAKRLGVTRQAVSKWRHGERSPSADEARALAELIGAPAGMVMAECEAQRAKDEATRAEWLRVARMCQRQAGTITSLALGLALIVSYLTTGDAETALASMAWIGAIAPNTNYGGSALVLALAWIVAHHAIKTPLRPFALRPA